MNEQITELLKQCTVHGVPQLGIEDHVNIEKFAELVEAAAVAREREACAKLCEERGEYSMQIPCPDGIVGCGVFHTVRGSKLKDGRECAAAIRARGEK
jgi:hypothetical protein